MATEKSRRMERNRPASDGVRAFDPAQCMPLLEELLREGQTLCLTVTGESMAPFLRHGRDQIRFRRPDRPLRRGDMAFFRRANGQYVMHRVLRAEKSGALYLVGDAQQEVEGPIAPQQVFAVVTEVCRKEKWLRPGCFWWDFFAGPLAAAAAAAAIFARTRALCAAGAEITNGTVRNAYGAAGRTSP